MPQPAHDTHHAHPGCRTSRLLALVVAAMLLVACGNTSTGDDATRDPSTSDSTPSGPTTTGTDAATGATDAPTSAADGSDDTADNPDLAGDLIVHAAASLTDAFSELGDAFEQLHPDLDVQMNFAGSQALATQIEQGAPGGVFASANHTQMERVSDALDDAPADFARNSLVVVTPADNPGGVSELADLADDELTVVLAAPDVPVGSYSREVLEAAGLTVEPDSLELDVRAVLTKVTTGNADAGMVYATDAATSDDVTVIEIPADVNIDASYPIAVLAGDQVDAGASFVDHVLSDDGQQILATHGFSQP